MRRRILLAALASILAFVACTSDTSGGPEAAPSPGTDGSPTPAASGGDAASVLVEVDGYVYADPPEAWKAGFDAVQELVEGSVDSAVRTVRKGEQAVAVVWVTVVEEAKQFDNVPNQTLREEAEADALAEFEGNQVAEAKIETYADARIIHAQPSDEGWKHVYIWPVKPSTIVRFMGDDPAAISAYIRAFVEAS